MNVSDLLLEKLNGRILVTLDKRTLAREIKRIIKEWGENALAFKDGKVTEIWFHHAKQNAQQKLVLYSGALASIILQENPLQENETRVQRKNQLTTT